MPKKKVLTARAGCACGKCNLTKKEQEAMRKGLDILSPEADKAMRRAEKGLALGCEMLGVFVSRRGEYGTRPATMSCPDSVDPFHLYAALRAATESLHEALYGPLANLAESVNEGAQGG